LLFVGTLRLIHAARKTYIVHECQCGGVAFSVASLGKTIVARISIAGT
jgi:hypothetical protein